MHLLRYPKSAPPIWAYVPTLYARVIVVRTSLGTLLMGTPAQLATMGIDTAEGESAIGNAVVRQKLRTA